MRALTFLLFLVAIPVWAANESVTIDTKTKKVVNPVVKFGSGNTLDCTGATVTNCGSGGGGGVSSIATTSPITGGTITSTGTIGLNVGVDHSFTVGQTITSTDAANNGLASLLSIKHSTSGTPANGLGSRILFSADDSTTPVYSQATISSAWSDVTHATATAYLSFSTRINNVFGEHMRIWGDGAVSVNNTTDPGVPGISARFIPQAHAVTSATSWTPDSNTYDQEAQTALAGDLTVNAPSGTPSDGKKLILWLTNNGTPHNLTWDSIYSQMFTSLPASIAASKNIAAGCIYRTNISKWVVMVVSVEP